MKSDPNKKEFANWSLENVGELLYHKFPQSDIVVVQPSRWLLITKSFIYVNASGHYVKSLAYMFCDFRTLRLPTRAPENPKAHYVFGKLLHSKLVFKVIY